MSERLTVPKSDYDLCDAENSNLRRHLLWAAQFLSPDQKAELRKRANNLRTFLSDWSRQPAKFIPWGDTHD